MSDMKLPVVSAPMKPDPGPRIIRLIQHIASSFPTPINGFGSELAAEAQQTEQQLTLTHPHR
jgi:hypothetical protein